MDEYYEDGIVAYYLCDEEGISFEYTSGLTAFYSPSHEGEASGYGDITLLTFDPFETDPGNKTMTNMAYQSGRYIDEALDVDNFVYLKNEEVFPFLLEMLPTSDFLLWNGHGNYVSHYGKKYPVLLTGEKATDILGSNGLSLTVNETVCEVKGNGSYWAITPYFVGEHISLDQGLVYLSSCQSGRDDTLAAAFVDSGAQVVFVNVGESDVSTAYTQTMMEQVISCMSAEADGIFHTASEALNLANDNMSTAVAQNGGIDGYSSWDEFIAGRQGGTHVEIRGDDNYTLCPCIRGEIAYDESFTDEEIAEISGRLSVRLENEYGKSVATAEIEDSDKFYFNNLEPGIYYVTLYVDGKNIKVKQQVDVKMHHYTSISLPCGILVPLEGYVYDEYGDALEGVSVISELAEYPDWDTSETVTNEDGYYSIDAYFEDQYTLSYRLEGYASVTNEFEVTFDMYEGARNGNITKIDDVVLSDIGCDFKITGGEYGVDWTFSHDVVKILTDTALTICNKNKEIPTSQSIYIESGINACITLDGVNIDSKRSALQIADFSSGDVTIILGDGSENTLISGTDHAGLQKSGDVEEDNVGTLVIMGNGKLTATGGRYGAGIGGRSGSGTPCDTSNIVIKGGIIIATGGESAAGIGGATQGSAVNIIIESGNVTAIGGTYAAGIGGGSGAEVGSAPNSGSDITINGGVLVAIGGDNGGSGIGGGGSCQYGGKGGDGINIIINGGTVTAYGGNCVGGGQNAGYGGGAGIGGGGGDQGGIASGIIINVASDISAIGGTGQKSDSNYYSYGDGADIGSGGGHSSDGVEFVYD